MERNILKQRTTQNLHKKVTDKTRITDDESQCTYNAERSYQMSSTDTKQQRLMHIEC